MGDCVNVKRTVIESSILVVFLALTLSILLRNQDIAEILGIIKNCNPIYIIAGILSMGAYVLLMGLCSKIFLKSRGYKMSIFRCFKYGFTEIYFSAITPSSTGGQPMAALSMRNDGYPIMETTPALISTAGIYKFSLLCLSIVCCIFFGRQIFADCDTWVIVLFIVGFIINCIVVLCIWIFLFSNIVIWYLFRFILKIGCALKIIKNKRKTIGLFRQKRIKYLECANYIKEQPKNVIKVFFVCVAQRLAISAVSPLVYMAMGLGDFSIGLFVYIIAIQIIVAISVEILPLPGAVGVSEAVFLALYMPLFNTPELLNAGMLLTRGISFYCLFIVSGIFVNICYISKVVKQFLRGAK